MQIKKWVYFDSKHEKTTFIDILKSSKSEMEAIQKLMQIYPTMSMLDLEDAVKNFSKEIQK